MQRKAYLLFFLSVILCSFLLSLAGCGGVASAVSTVATAAQSAGGAIEVSLIVPAGQSKGSKVSDGYVALAGATVSVVGQNKSAVTDSAGYAKITGLVAGTYTVTVGKEGYQTVTYSNVTVSSTLTTVVGVSSGIIIQVSTNPGIMDLSATSGSAGASITIAGINFGSTQGTSTVTFNGVTVTTVTSWSSTSIVCAVPSGATTGNVVVTVGGATSNGLSFTITTGAPNIDALSPASGTVGASITIFGSNFGSSQGSSTITFNGTTVTSVTYWSSGQIVCTVPAGTTTGNVVVTVGGVASNGASFTITSGEPHIDTLSPSSGAIGASVTIYGSNFGSTQGSSTITFNGTSVTSVAYWSSNQIICTAPTGTTTGNVVVTVGSTASNGASFTINTPNIGSLSTSSGEAGDSITITGTGFVATQGSSTVKFNGTAATINSWSATSIVCTVPSGASTGNVVVNVNGNDSNGVAFTVLPISGWVSVSETWTYKSADAPSFVFDVNADVTSKYSAGMRVKYTQTTVKYGIITKIGAYASGKTPITIYGGTDYVLADAAITSPAYSGIKAPYGFPLDPAKWTVAVQDTRDIGQASPVSGTVYNLGSILISIPIGSWHVSHQESIYGSFLALSCNTAMFSSLSTANDSFSDSDFTTESYIYSAGVGNLIFSVFRSKNLTLTSKTTYYMVARADIYGGSINFWGATTNPTTITAVCNYL